MIKKYRFLPISIAVPVGAFLIAILSYSKFKNIPVGIAIVVVGVVFTYLLLKHKLSEQESAEETDKLKQENQKLKKINLEQKDSQKAISIPTNNDGYCIPSELKIFKFGEVNSNGNYQLSVLSIFTVKFLIEGDIRVKKFLESPNVIQNIEPISDPKKILYEEGMQQTIVEAEFDNVKVGQEEIVAFKSMRHLNIKLQKPNLDAPSVLRQDKNILKTLYDDCLVTDYCKDAGIYTAAYTEKVKFLIYFPKNFMPVNVNVIQITSGGGKDKRGFILDNVQEKNLWVVECYKPKYHSGIHVYWDWSKESIETLKQKPHPLKKE